VQHVTIVQIDGVMIAGKVFFERIPARVVLGVEPPHFRGAAKTKGANMY
jgi:hypothetical protein